MNTLSLRNVGVATWQVLSEQRAPSCCEQEAQEEEWGCSADETLKGGLRFCGLSIIAFSRTLSMPRAAPSVVVV
eukprot:3773220-Pleurochrysis_carterae.AAC.1